MVVPDQPPESIGFLTFFRYMTRFDKMLFVIGTFSAVLAGIILPSISLIMANVAQAFSNPNFSGISGMMG